jgi:hypothetical protein
MARRILRDHTMDSNTSAAERLSLLREEMAHYIVKARHPYLDAYRPRATCDLILNGCESPEVWKEQILYRVRKSPVGVERSKQGHG